MNDCYDFVVSYATKFGKVYPTISGLATATYQTMCSKTRSEKEKDSWKKCEPHNGALVLMGLSPARMHHVGVYEDGNVVHKLEGVTRSQSLSSIKKLYKQVEVYKWVA
jgi:hypothetical protein